MCMCVYVCVHIYKRINVTGAREKYNQAYKLLAFDKVNSGDIKGLKNWGENPCKVVSRLDKEEG